MMCMELCHLYVVALLKAQKLEKAMGYCMKEDIRTYYVKFAVDTVHTEAVVKAYSESDAETLLKKQYTNCKIFITEINRVLGEDVNEDKQCF